MKRNNYIIYIFEFIIALYTAFYSFLLFSHNLKYLTIINIIFWTVIFVLSYSFLKFYKDNNYLKKYANNIVLIVLLSLLIFMYGLGLFTGYARSVYSHSVMSILKNIVPVILTVSIQEYFRYTVAKNGQNNRKPLYLLVLLYIVFNTVSYASTYSFVNLETVFIFAMSVFLPIVAKELVLSYIVYHCSLASALILRIPVELYSFVLPFYPNIGNYLSGLIGICYPFILYVLLRKGVNYNLKKDLSTSKYTGVLIIVPLFIFVVTMASLVSGIFDYKLIAIGSNSMKGTYERGDAVIYKQYKGDEVDYSDIKVGEILVFNTNYKVVTHRIIKIKEKDGKRIYVTKGDANDAIDSYVTTDAEVLGVVTYKIDYIGYPTIWLSEALSKE